jgi:ribosomal protein RSM22 (predicted rRNA methylase)
MGPFSIEPLSDAFGRALSRAVNRKLDARSLPALVERVSRKYLGESQSIAKPDELAARALFFLPRDVHKVVAPLAELALQGALPDRPLRILDVGAGVGASTLGALLAFEALGRKVQCVHALDEDREALAVAQRIFESLREDELIASDGPTITTRLGRADDPRSLRDAAGGAWDVVIVCNVLTEVLRAEDSRMDAPRDEAARAARVAELIEGIARLAPLSEDGAILVIEPAMREDARVLQRARASVAERGLSVFAPCTHDGACPLLARERDWCHDDVNVDLPEWLRGVARSAGLRYQGLTYAYLTVRAKPGRVRAQALREGWVSARLVSAVRETKGKREAFLCAPVVSPRADEGASLDEGAADPLRAMQLDRAVKGAREGAPMLSDCVRGELVAIAPETLPEGESRTVRLGVDDWARGESPGASR